MSEPNELEELGRVYGVEEHSHYGNVLRYAIEELERLRVADSIRTMSEPRVVVIRGEEQFDVTEAVKTMYDLLASSMDWGSHFLSIEDVTEVTRLAEVCGFVGLEGAHEQLVSYLSALGGACPICKERGTLILGGVTEEGREVRIRYVDSAKKPDGSYEYTERFDPHTAVLIQPPHQPAYLYWPDLETASEKGGPQ